MFQLFLILSLFISGSSLACAGGSTSVGDGNPASLHCEKVDGILVLFEKDQAGGAQQGLCITKDFAMIGEWTLFHSAQRGKPSQAQLNFLSNSLKPQAGQGQDWARQNCISQGGAIESYVERLRSTLHIDLCVFPDQSIIEVFTLLRGGESYPELKRLLVF